MTPAEELAALFRRRSIDVMTGTEAGSEAADLFLPTRHGGAWVVVVTPERPRGAEASLIRDSLEAGEVLIVLDEQDISGYRGCPGGASAGFLVEEWWHGQTHANGYERG
jgi:hypothetical protein